MQILDRLDKGEKGVKLAAEFDVSTACISKTKNDRENIRKQAATLSDELQARQRVTSHGAHPLLEAVLLEWFSLARAQKIAGIGRPHLAQKALSIAKDFTEAADKDGAREELKKARHNLKDFKASPGFITGFMARHNIIFAVEVGEAGSVDLEVVKACQEKLRRDLDPYALRDIWNLDETGLQFRCEPLRSLVFKAENHKGTKKDKERITECFLVSAEGEKFPPLFIGKSKNPRCFQKRNRNTLPMTYRNQPKAWMNTTLFVEYLTSFNAAMKLAKRKVVLLLDNAPVHCEMDLSNVKLLFFSPNVTSLIQLLDQGIIKSFKTFYRALFVAFVLECMEKNEAAKIDVLKAMEFSRAAFAKIPRQTIKNCFAKCDILPIIVQREMEEDKEEVREAARPRVAPIGALTAGMDELSAMLAKLAMKTDNKDDVLSADEFVNFDDEDKEDGEGAVDVDDNLALLERVLGRDDEVVAEGVAEDDEDERKVDVDEVVMVEPKPVAIRFSAALTALKTLQDFLGEQDWLKDNTFTNVCLDMGAALRLQQAAALVQPSVASFFPRKEQ